MGTFFALLTLCAGNSRSPLNSPYKGKWRKALMFSLICAWINGWVNYREAGDLRRHGAHYDVIVMITLYTAPCASGMFTCFNRNCVSPSSLCNYQDDCKDESDEDYANAQCEGKPILTHWGRDKMAAISQTTHSNAFSWMKMYAFRLRFHWSLFLRVQLTIIQHCFR